MDKLREISEREKIARIKLSILQRQHAKALKKLQKAELKMQKDSKRRKTIHGYPTMTPSITRDLKDGLGVILEGSFSSEEPDHRSCSQPSNLLREDNSSSPLSSSELSKKTSNSTQSQVHNCFVNAQRMLNEQNTETPAGCKSFIDVTICDTKNYFVDGKNNNHCTSKENINISSNENTREENISSRSSTRLDSPVPDVLSENSSYSENSYKLQVNTVCADSNNDIIDTSNKVKVNNSRREHSIVDDEKNFENDHKTTLPISGCIHEIPNQSKPRTVEQKETIESSSLTNKNWLHLFEEPFPRRSPRIRNKPNYNEMSLSQSFINSQSSDFSSKLYLDNSSKMIDSASNSTCSTTNTAKVVNVSKSEFINSNDKSECLEPKKCLSSKNCKTSQQTTKKNSRRKQTTQTDNFVNISKKPLEYKTPNQVNNNWSALHSINKKIHSNSLCTFLFPKPPLELVKPGGPLSMIVDFSLPDKEFATLKLQKIKNTRMNNHKFRASLCKTNSLTGLALPAGVSEDDSAGNKKVACKLKKADKQANQSFQTSEGKGTKEEPMTEKCLDSCRIIEVEQNQKITRERDIDYVKSYKENQTSQYTEVKYPAFRNDQSYDKNRNHNESKSSKSSNLKEDILVNQNEIKQANKNFELYPKVKIDLTTQREDGSTLQDLRKPQNLALFEKDTLELSVGINTLTKNFDRSPPKDTFVSTHDCESEMPFACTSSVTTIDLKCISRNSQECFGGSDVTPLGKDDNPKEKSLTTPEFLKSSDSNDRSVMVPVLMQSCLQHSFPGYKNKVLFLAMSSYEFPVTNGGPWRKTEVVAVCFSHIIVVWVAQLGNQWQILCTWTADKSEEFLEICFVTIKSELVLLSGGNFLKGNARLCQYKEDKESTFELKQKMLDSPSLFSAMCHVDCGTCKKRQENFTLAVASCTGGKPLVTKWLLESSGLTVKSVVSLPLAEKMNEVVSLCGVDECSNVMLGTTKSLLLIWNIRKDVLLRVIHVTDVGLLNLCCLKALSYKGLLLITMATYPDVKLNSKTNGTRPLTALASTCCLYAVNPTTGRMAPLLDFCVSSDEVLVTAAWATNGQYLALGRHDGSINLWNVAFSRYTIELPVFHEAATCISFHPNRPVAAFGSELGCVHVYSLR